MFKVLIVYPMALALFFIVCAVGALLLIASYFGEEVNERD
jgi:hypothetical protein